jgi:hypothetical protein
MSKTGKTSKTFRAKLAVIGVSMPRQSQKNTHDMYQIVELLDPHTQKIWQTYIVDNYYNKQSWYHILSENELKITTIIEANWAIIKGNIISADARPEIWHKFDREEFAQTLAEHHGDRNNQSYT